MAAERSRPAKGARATRAASPAGKKAKAPSTKAPAKAAARPKKTATKAVKRAAPAKTAQAPATAKQPPAPGAHPGSAALPADSPINQPASQPAQAPALAWEPVPEATPPVAVLPPRPPQPRTFDPATGAWLQPIPPASPEPARPDPAAARKTGVAMMFHALFLIDLAFVALNLVLGLAIGGLLVFAPDSEMAQDARDSLEVSSPEGLAYATALSFAMFGLVPLAWVLGTRVRPWEGTLKYLQLRFALKDWLLGIGLAIGLLVAVIAVSAAYVCYEDGCDALTGDDEGENPAVQALVENLNWPLVVFISLAAGIGEEILFRGILQKYVRWWGQAILFGLAHAGGGYLPQVIVATGIGFLFGWLVKRGWSLWTMMLAHILYDFVLLATALASRGA